MKSILRATLALTAIVGIACGAGCVASRPARNGVFNENTYIRKDFLTRPGVVGADGKPAADSGWYVVGTVTETSAPNVLVGQVFTGLTGEPHLVRFQVTQDHLNVLDQRETTANPGQGVIPMVLDSWSATNIDLKYRVNLDGEQTNFYEENQEAPWADRQFVKLNLAKNDLSDLSLLGYQLYANVNHCTDIAESSTALVPGSIHQEMHEDPSNDYLSWKIQLTVPVRTDLVECLQMYNQVALATAFGNGKPNVTMNIMYSMKRATPTNKMTYQPLVVDEKDPIRHKYASLIESSSRVWDENNQLQASRQVINRYDPTKDIVWYFEKGFPERYKAFFCAPASPQAGVSKACAAQEVAGQDTVRSAVNAIMVAAGAKHPDGAPTVVIFKNYDEDLAPGQAPREYGDVRYNFQRWSDDLDNSDFFAGATMSRTDPRNGEIQMTNIVYQNVPVKDYYAQRIDAYLEMLGASEGLNSVDSKTGLPSAWKDGPANCKDGDTIPFVQSCDSGKNCINQANGRNTLYSKMQGYLNRPAPTYGNLGPADFVQAQDDDFFQAYYALLPYLVYSDPSSNQYVTPEGQGGVYGPPPGRNYWDTLRDEAEFYKRAGDMDHGKDPYDGTGPGGSNLANAATFLNRMKELTINHEDFRYAKLVGNKSIRMDSGDSFSFESIIQHDARHCIAGHWETKEEWTQSLIDTYWREVMWHEFGHSLGLDHNFMGSVDRNNFPKYKDGSGRSRFAMYSNSVMEYTANASRIFDGHGNLYGPWDQGALGWIYANSCKDNTSNTSCKDTATKVDVTKTWISGQASATAPWKDPLGWNGNTELKFLSCNSTQTKYTPLCKAGDQGTTPSEIIANQIVTSEWGYQWRNFRAYRKFWDNSHYADTPAGMVHEMRKFMSLWVFDWSSGEIVDTLHRIGIVNPDPNGSDVAYFQQLTNKFNAELSAANGMVAAYHKAVIQQGSGERPFGTVYDKFYGDVTQQGIILDKFFAMQSWVGLWQTDNYDQNQAGSYIASYAGIGDSTFNAIAEDTVDSMVGGQYNVYPYFRPLAVVQFAQDTHSPSFSGRREIRDWVGGQTFYRLKDFLDYFRNIAVTNNYKDAKNGVDCTSQSFDKCTFDPRPQSDNHNEFVGPDKRVWIWAFIPDRNEYVAVLKDRNTASYLIVRAYNDDVVAQLDDGAFPGGAYGLELPVKYMLDSFNQYK